MRRLPLGPVDVGRVATAAGVCEQTVRRWLHGIGGHQAQDRAIRAALDQLDLHPVRRDPMQRVDQETTQLLIPVVDIAPDNPPATTRGESGNGGQFGAGRQPHKRLSGESPNMGQPGDARFCLPGLDDSTSPTPGTPAERSAPFMPPPTLDEVAELVAPYVRPAAPAQRCRVTCELPDGTAVTADERPGHWWEPRPEEGAP